MILSPRHIRADRRIRSCLPRCTVPGAAHLPPARTGLPTHPAARAGTFLQSLIRAVHALNDHWLGDVIGALSIFVLLWGGLLAAWVFS
ncbi:hypothetical protein [Ruegeria atlantica]|uniref:hypothetical protein n=1 Tax=Ruegeria atlantica TaxID=81569 RepID=UPI00147B30C2|nr:hypothetical protein [Ruegeria atlantica]